MRKRASLVGLVAVLAGALVVPTLEAGAGTGNGATAAKKKCKKKNGKRKCRKKAAAPVVTPVLPVATTPTTPPTPLPLTEEVARIEALLVAYRAQLENGGYAHSANCDQRTIYRWDCLSGYNKVADGIEILCQWDQRVDRSGYDGITTALIEDYGCVLNE